MSSVSAGLRRQLPWSVGAAALVGLGYLTARLLSKRVGDGGVLSYDTAGSRVGWVVAATGCCLLLVAAFGFALWLKPVGMVLMAVVLAAAVALLIREPQVSGTNRRTGEAFVAGCGETVLHNGFLRESPWELRTPLQRDCQERGRLITGLVAGGVLVSVTAIGITLRRKESQADGNVKD